MDIAVIGLGILAAIRLDHWIHPDTFRKMVLALLVIMGSGLLLAYRLPQAR